MLGASTLGGRSAFVLTTGQAAYDPNNPQNPGPNLDMDESALRLWNPLTGVCSSIKDVTGEMRQVLLKLESKRGMFAGRRQTSLSHALQVGTVYDHTNMWANIQSSSQPWEMKWNLNDQSAWLPFFGLFMPLRELATLQVTILA